MLEKQKSIHISSEEIEELSLSYSLLLSLTLSYSLLLSLTLSYSLLLSLTLLSKRRRYYCRCYFIIHGSGEVFHLGVVCLEWEQE